MTRYVLTAAARADITEIWLRIAVDSEEAADQVEQAMFDACEFLADFPMAGRSRLAQTKRNLRSWTLPRYRNYIVIYKPDTRPLEVIAVLHGKRNIPRVLKSRAV